MSNVIVSASNQAGSTSVKLPRKLEAKILSDGEGSQNTVASKNYDTVTSVHDIEQDDHIYYAENKGNNKDASREPLMAGFQKLGKILEVPSKNITRNNSINDVNEIANSKF